MNANATKAGLIIVVAMGLWVTNSVFGGTVNSHQDTTQTQSTGENIDAVPTPTSFDVPPKPLNGYEAIQTNLTYPETAFRAGMEGRVLVWIHIDEKGKVIHTKVHQSLSKDCDEAAIDAITSVKWKPALHRERSVSVWVLVPIDFRLR